MKIDGFKCFLESHSKPKKTMLFLSSKTFNPRFSELNSHWSSQLSNIRISVVKSSQKLGKWDLVSKCFHQTPRSPPNATFHKSPLSVGVWRRDVNPFCLLCISVACCTGASATHHIRLLESLPVIESSNWALEIGIIVCLATLFISFIDFVVNSWATW